MHMSKEITLFVFCQPGARVQSLSVSSNRIIFVLGLLMAVLAVMTAYVIDYGRLREARCTAFNMRHKLTFQLEEISRQRRQIQFFANEINILKSSLAGFRQFERKIRIISNLETAPGSSSLSGLGGPIPADLEVNVTVDESHDGLLREMHSQIKQVDAAAMVQRRGFVTLLGYLEEQRSLLSSTPSIWPADGWISSDFGYRSSPFTGMREFHKGIDIAAPDGNAVFATGDGRVVFAGPNGNMGKMIVIDHGHGMVTRYGHLRTFSKKRGEPLKRGDVIGFIGTSGRTTGPHLHYEVLVNGIPVKPRNHILN